MYYSLFVISLLSAGSLYGYYHRYKLFYYLLYILERIYNKTIPENDFKILESGTAASIRYTRSGRNYSLVVPYDSENYGRMMKVRVYLLRNGEEVDITHQNGLPYMATAAMMGGTKLIVVYKEKRVEYGPDELLNLHDLFLE